MVETLLSCFSYKGFLVYPDGFYTLIDGEYTLFDLTEPINNSVTLYLMNKSDNPLSLWDMIKLLFTNPKEFRKSVSFFYRVLVYVIVIAVVLLVLYILLSLVRSLFLIKRRR